MNNTQDCNICHMGCVIWINTPGATQDEKLDRSNPTWSDCGLSQAHMASRSDHVKAVGGWHVSRLE